jgi:integrase
VLLPAFTIPEHLTTMPRPRVGSAFRHGDHYDIQITLPDGSRGQRMCQPPEMSEARARDKAKRLTELAAKGAELAPKAGAEEQPPGETFAKWSERWCDDRAARGLTSVKDDRGRLRKWVLPTLGNRPMVEIKRLDLERLVEELDENVRADLLSWKTAQNTWGVVSKAFDDACRSKTLALRVLTENPACDVRGPDDGIHKAKSYLYPSEFLLLASCPRVPIRWRRLIAAGIYAYTREGELEALGKEDVDRQARTIHVHRAIDRTTDGETKETKTNAPRRIPIEPALVPLLDVLIAETPGPSLVAMPPACDLSPRLRQYLAWAGVTRAELFAGDKTRKAITWHELSATGITWMAIRGDDPLKIQRRAGHGDLSTTQGYIREAENLTGPIGAPFPPLPAVLVSLRESLEGPAYWGQLRESTWKKRASPAGFEPHPIC